MYKPIIALFLLALATGSYARINGWVNCGSTATIHSVEAGDCEQTPCSFRRENTYNILVRMTANDHATSLPYIVNATILGQPWEIMRGDGCDQVPCPVQVGQAIAFQYQYTVLNTFPPVPTTVITHVNNQLGQRTVCFELPIQIV